MTLDKIAQFRDNAARKGITPSNCSYCEYDRRFPGFKRGGWLQSENNGPIMCCPLCNADGRQPRGD